VLFRDRDVGKIEGGLTDFSRLEAQNAPELAVGASRRKAKADEGRLSVPSHRDGLDDLLPLGESARA
jgi:hypothetical protein